MSMTMLSINTNVGALKAATASYSVNKSMETSMNRLSTGKRINSAADDAAGLQISQRLTAEIRGIDQAIRNADVVLTDKVISMNDKVNKKKKIKEFLNFKIN